MRVEFDSTHGTIQQVLDKVGPVELHSKPELAENFRLLVASPDGPASYVLGKDQQLTKADVSPDRLTLHWNGPMHDAQGRSHTIQAAMTIVLTGPAVEFQFQMANRTEHVVQEVWFPGIGGLFEWGSAGGRGDATLNPPPHHTKQIRRPFGVASINYPGQNMGFIDIGNPTSGRGLYFGSHDPIAQFQDISLCGDGAGESSNLVFHLMHYPMIPAGGRFESGPFVWCSSTTATGSRAGKKIYRPWFEKTFGLMTPDRDWIRQHSFFQFIMLMLPEGNINYTIAEIPQLARDGLQVRRPLAPHFRLAARRARQRLPLLRARPASGHVGRSRKRPSASATTWA